MFLLGVDLLSLSFLLGYTVVLLLSNSLLVFSKVTLFGSLLYSLVLQDYLSAHPFPDGLLYQLWYLDDGVFVGSHIIFLDVLQDDGCGFGSCPNLSKCEVFWPSGAQCFSEFPSSVKCVSFAGVPLIFLHL